MFLTKYRLFLFKDLKKLTIKMNNVFDQFKSMWSKSVVNPSTDVKNVTNVQIFHKARLNSIQYHDMIDYLKEEFYNTKQNVFEMHIFLVENCLDKNDLHKFASACLINHAFVEWRNQIRNIIKKKNTTHLTSSCKDENECYCTLNDSIIKTAFNLVVTRRNMNLLSSFNKIYNFNENYHLLQPTTVNYMSKLNYTDQATLIGELQVQEKFDIENIVIPLMLLDKYASIDEIINKDQKTMLLVIEICDSLCNSDTNLKEIAQKYPDLKSKKIDKFKSKAIAKYASTTLKKNKKLSLISSQYSNIAHQLKLSQMRFLVNLKYDKMATDPISFDAWSELLLDLIGEDERLQYKLLLELIQYQKDVQIANRFLSIFGYDKNINKLPESLREFFIKNIQIIQQVQKDSSHIINTEKYYYPEHLLNDTNIKFVQTKQDFIQMLDYFEETKPDAIGQDCEWKPSFDLIDTSTETEESSKRNRSSTYQIATRDKCFILDMKDLIDSIDESIINRFGQLILFNENLLKLGYSFQQDAKKLSISFPSFRHRFSEFEEDVVNIDEIVNSFQKKWKLFTDTDEFKQQKQSKGLSELTRRCFGKPLNKSECISNWDARPLRDAQLKYAALDAFVLLQIHDFIQDRIKTLGINFDYSSKKMCF